MADVLITTKGQECIANGTVLADADEPFEMLITDADEHLKLIFVFKDDQVGGFGSGDIGVNFRPIDQQTARVTFLNVKRNGGGPFSFGPLAIATFKERDLSLILHVAHFEKTIEATYSFWLRVD